MATNFKIARLQQMVAYLKTELDRANRLLNSALAEAKSLSAKDAALLAVGNATQASGDRFADSDEVRQYGLVVAYAVIEAALNEQPTLPECFTVDDLVLASDILAGEMSRGWSK